MEISLSKLLKYFAPITAIGSAVAYALTFLYEQEYCRIYGMPTELISVDLTMITPFWTKVMVVLLIIATIFVTLHTFFLNRVSAKISISAVGSSGFVFGIVLGSAGIFTTSFLILMYVLFFSIEFGVLMLLDKKYRLKNLLIHQDNNTEPFNYAQRFIVSLVNKLTKPVVFVFFTLSVLMTFAYIITISSARKEANLKTLFYSLEDDPSVVVLRIYGDKLISGKIDLNKGKFTNVYQIKKIGDTPMKLVLMDYPFLSHSSKKLFIWRWQISE